MKSPQVENGFTTIANELLDALWKIRVSGEEVQMFNFIMRKTYGYKKKASEIDLNEFCAGTGMKKPNAIRAIKHLLEKHMIIKNDNEIIINKDNDSWKPLSKKITKVINIDKKSEEKESNKEKELILKKKEILTNVSRAIAPIESFGNPDINEGIDLLKAIGPATKSQLNRFALKRLYNQHGKEMTLAVFIFAQEYKDFPYCPQIYNFLDLEEKWAKLEGFAQRSMQKDKPIIATMPKQL